MTTSERLRELAAFRSAFGGPAEAAVMDALPLIADVVEAAEHKAHIDDNGWLTGIDHPSPCSLCAALTALREALE